MEVTKFRWRNIPGHNNVRDFVANLLSQVCVDVEKEPPLQPLTGETIVGNPEEGARPDIRARGFWRPAQNAFLTSGSPT